jgi:mannose-6-phosphate isomerase-like protein (cupin superfamily)
MNFDSRSLSEKPEYLAPDGSAVRLLCEVERGGMAHFTLPAGHISRSVVHQTVDELWYIVNGEGQMWRKQDQTQQVTPLHPGMSLSIPVGTAFQFRASEAGPLTAVSVTMPPWPGPNEAQPAEGYWPPTV